MFRLLLDAGCDPNAVDRSGSSVLSAACALGRVPMAKALIAAGADARRKKGGGALQGRGPAAAAVASIAGRE